MLLALSTGAGCDCGDGGPGLDVDANGAPAIGWEVSGQETVTGVRVEAADGTVIWAIESEGVAPTVIPIGQDVEGFDTTVPWTGAIDLNGRVLSVDWTRDGQQHTGQWPYTAYAYEPNHTLAKVTDLECGSFRQHLPVTAIALWAGALSVLGFVVMAALAAMLSRRDRANHP